MQSAAKIREHYAFTDGDVAFAAFIRESPIAPRQHEGK